MSRILGAGDPHGPVDHPGYCTFCQDIYDEYDCDIAVIIGDLTDQQAISFHAVNPDCPGALDEYRLTKKCIRKWYKAFPNAKICIGNHDERVIKKAQSVGIPAKYLKSYSEMWGTPNWVWEYEHYIDDICFMHGIGRGGIHPAWNAMSKKMQSVVMGHCHSRAGVKFRTIHNKRFFAIDTGCGIDVDAFQFAYGKHCGERPVLGCCVIIDGLPYYEVMPCGPGELYHKSNFKKRKR